MDPEPVRDERGSHQAAAALESTARHAIFQLATDGSITTWPAPAVDLYGYTPEEALGSSLALLFEEPGSPERTPAVLLARANNGHATQEATHERADGTSFWAELTISPMQGGADAEGYVAVAADTSDRKERERTLERQNDRLKEFTDILVHDLRNPLHVIDRRLDLYRETGDPTHLESLAETTDRMERLVDDLLRVARQGYLVSDPEPTDVEAVIRTAWEGAAAGHDEATLRSEPIPTLDADPDRLCELFENLFRNAVEHGSTRQPSRVRTDADDHVGSDVTVVVGPMDGGFYVEDDGPGIPADLREEVFDHGVSTVDDGTGYGLSVVRTIASAHDWDVVAAESATGGARFEFRGVDFAD